MHHFFGVLVPSPRGVPCCSCTGEYSQKGISKVVRGGYSSARAAQKKKFVVPFLVDKKFILYYLFNFNVHRGI